MPEPVNAAIEKALLDKAIAFAATQSLTISVENGLGADGKHFTKPSPAKGAQWLRATMLPAPARKMGIADTSDEQHYGFLQIDVIQGLGGGTLPMQRVISAIRAFMPIGTVLTESGFSIKISHYPTGRAIGEGPLMNDGDGWVKIPVSIPWVCF